MIYHRHLPASLPGYFRALDHPKTDFPALEIGYAAILAPEGRPMVIWGERPVSECGPVTGYSTANWDSQGYFWSEPVRVPVVRAVVRALGFKISFKGYF